MADFSEAIKRLEEEQKWLDNELEQLRSKSRPVSERREGSPFGKREEEADAVFELEKRLALERQLTETLAKVNHALEKHKAGAYGICEDCGQ